MEAVTTLASSLCLLTTLTVILPVARGQFIEPRLCTQVCVCVPDEQAVVCTRQDDLLGIPANIDQSVQKLMIQHGRFVNPVIRRQNLTGLQKLSHLKVVYCGIRSIDSRAFAGMSLLRYLDLSHNQLQTIYPFTFFGLNLDALHLMANPGIVLQADSFKGLRTNQLNLRSNGIRELLYETFADINVRKLYLFNNSIQRLDHRFGELFKDPEHLMDVTGNPLHCTCQISWLFNLLNSQPEQSRNSINITCATPRHLAGRQLRSLDRYELPCPTPRIQAISLDLMPSAEVAQLTCYASGNPSPSISWAYGEGGNVQELRRLPQNSLKDSYIPEQFDYQQQHQLVQTSLTINVSLVPHQRTYTCIAWNEENSLQKVSIQLRGPPNLNNSPSLTFTESNPNSKVDSELSQRNQLDNPHYPKNGGPKSEISYIYQKQFTFLEMGGAVLGTFITTGILLFGISRCIRYFCESSDKQKKAASWQPQEPAYSAAGSHEYDIPRVEQSAAHYPPSPRQNEIEFLDFKTQRKIFSAS